MSTSQPSSASSEGDETVYPQAMASSLAGLPVRNNSTSTEETSEAAEDSKPQSGQVKEFLDLATSRSDSSDIATKLEQKRLEFERQRELQKKAFEEQMEELKRQQEAEERALLERSDGGLQTAEYPTPQKSSGTTATSNSIASNAVAPTRSRSGNDLVSFGVSDRAPAREVKTKRADYANARSMPGSRRHSGDVKDSGAIGDTPATSIRRKGNGESILNSFLFDDELDADLQNSAWGGKYLQMNTDDDKFPILVRRDSYPGILSASSAALDLAPLSQAPTHPGRGVSGSGRPSAASEWPQFQATAKPDAATAANNAERRRSITQGQTAPSSPAVALPPPRSAMAVAQQQPTASGRNSPALDKKIGNGLESNVSGGKKYAGSDSLSGLATPTSGFVDSMTDQFSNFTIDPNATFGGYGHEHGAFAYDGAAGGFGSMGANRFAGLRLEDLQGDMLPLCKDQFGCRYLQKKLEDGNPEHRDMIFNEIFPHFAELMTDPFANYLSQRLLEYSTDEQRDALIDSISGELVSISLNMHGTRAVQKMIDFLSTKRQVQSLILALNLNVVTLIKDLNGNHVIQKCLNHLPPEDNQFIYNAVATHCIEVATHRHGCCVLQRCIDHASESQRIQLVTEITYNSLTLVQDAFGNYVVQYVLDLNDNRFIEAIVRQFLGNVAALSAQKFSSNVVEKCIRVADATGRRAIIDELLNKQRLERLLRDSFANYVVQTALDYAEPAQRAQLIETIRPILPMIRNTPYGKRIQSKIQRETNDHMGRGGYQHGGHPHMVPGGHFYNMGQMQPAPHQYMQHPGHFMPPEHNSRSPYISGFPPQGPPPPPLHHMGHQPSGMPGGQGFAPFQMGVQDYHPSPNGMPPLSNGMPPLSTSGSAGYSAGFM